MYSITRSRNRVHRKKKQNKTKQQNEKREEKKKKKKKKKGKKKKKKKKKKKNKKKKEKKKKKKKKKKDPGRIISIGLLTDDYSQASSHYRLARDLLPAAFGPWAGAVLIMQPGRSCGLLRSTHIDARLSAGARST